MKLNSNRKTQLLVYKNFRRKKRKIEKENKDSEKKKFQPKTIIEDEILVTLN